MRGDAPQGILTRDFADQVSDLPIQLGTSYLARSGLPTPVHPEALAMPFDHRLGLDDD
jgi:hypothetical protein